MLSSGAVKLLEVVDDELGAIVHETHGRSCESVGVQGTAVRLEERLCV